MSYDDLEKLNNLKEKGAISEEEYKKEKEKILNGQNNSNNQNGNLSGLDLNTYCTFLHLSQFLGILLPFAGLVAPIIMWVMYKDRYPEVDVHGKIVLNWTISVIIYYIVFIILCIVLIGVPLLIALVVCQLVFPIVGAIRASNSIYWKYPFSIEFIKYQK